VQWEAQQRFGVDKGVQCKIRGRRPAAHSAMGLHRPTLGLQVWRCCHMQTRHYFGSLTTAGHPVAQDTRAQAQRAPNDRPRAIAFFLSQDTKLTALWSFTHDQGFSTHHRGVNLNFDGGPSSFKRHVDPADEVVHFAGASCSSVYRCWSPLKAAQ